MIFFISSTKSNDVCFTRNLLLVLHRWSTHVCDACMYNVYILLEFFKRVENNSVFVVSPVLKRDITVLTVLVGNIHLELNHLRLGWIYNFISIFTYFLKHKLHAFEYSCSLLLNSLISNYIWLKFPFLCTKICPRSLVSNSPRYMISRSVSLVPWSMIYNLITHALIVYYVYGWKVGLK